MNIYIGNLALEVIEEELLKSSQLLEKSITRGELKVSTQMKLRTLYSLLAIGISLLIAGLTLVVIM